MKKKSSKNVEEAEDCKGLEKVKTAKFIYFSSNSGKVYANFVS